MQFGYFCNQTNRAHGKSFGDVIDEAREIAVHCDTHGWDSFWFTEHHFGHEGFEVCPNPIMMSADIAARTSRLRIGQAANIITFRHPITLAEDVAMLDHMSGGRVEVGVGRGIYGREAVNLNKAADVADPAQNYQIFTETLEIMRRAWANDFFEYSGDFYQFPEPGMKWKHAMSPADDAFLDQETGEIRKLALVPRTLQQPAPPLWQVVDSENSIRYAARNGLNAMMWIPPTDSLVWRFELYREERSETEGRNVPLGEGIAVVRDMFVADSMADAQRLGGDGLLDYLRWVCHYRGLSNHLYPGEELADTPGKLDLLSYEWLHPRNMLFGTPEYVCEQIEEMREKLNLQHLLVWSNFPGVEHSATMNSLRKFTEQVLPKFTHATARNVA